MAHDRPPLWAIVGNRGPRRDVEPLVPHVSLDLANVPGGLYRVLADTVVPRPIAFVSTVDEAGRPNLAPYSFFIVGGSAPPSLCFSPTFGRNGEKDSLRNARATGEFVVNLVVRGMAEGMNAASASLPHDESEWEPSGFTPLPSTLVRPARVAEAPVQFECRVLTIVEHGEGVGAARYVIGEAVAIHLDEALIGRTGDFRPIARVGGNDYLDLADGARFELERPA